MKNMKKLVALFAATVMTMSFGVSAFAAEVNTTVGADDASIADEAFNLVFTAPDGGETDIDQLTMIAYLVDDETTLETWEEYDGSQTIVAMDQIGGDEVFGSVPVDVAKLEAGKAIAVAIGGTDVAAANVYKALVTYTTTTQLVAYEIAYELGDGTAEGNPTESNSDETIAEFFAKVTAEPEKDGYTFKHWSKTADGEAINTASTDKMSTLLDDPAGTTVTLYAVYQAQVSAICVTFMNGDEVVDTVDTVDGKAVLTSKVPTLAANTGYATKAYTFVEWVTEDGTAVTAETPITANTTVYAKFDTGIVYGDATGDGQVKGLDRTYVHQFVANGKMMSKTNMPVSEYLTNVVAGDATGDGQIKGLDRTYVHQFVANGKMMSKTNTKIYVINK